MSRDGRRLIMLAPQNLELNPKGNLHATFLLNFDDWLAQRVPLKK